MIELRFNKDHLLPKLEKGNVLSIGVNVERFDPKRFFKGKRVTGNFPNGDGGEKRILDVVKVEPYTKGEKLLFIWIKLAHNQ